MSQTVRAHEPLAADFVLRRSYLQNVSAKNPLNDNPDRTAKFVLLESS